MIDLIVLGEETWCCRSPYSAVELEILFLVVSVIFLVALVKTQK